MCLLIIQPTPAAANFLPETPARPLKEARSVTLLNQTFNTQHSQDLAPTALSGTVKGKTPLRGMKGLRAKEGLAPCACATLMLWAKGRVE